MKTRRNSGRRLEAGKPRNVTLEFRVTGQERTEIERIADAHGMSLSGFIRESLKAAMEDKNDVEPA